MLLIIVFFLNNLIFIFFLIYCWVLLIKSFKLFVNGENYKLLYICFENCFLMIGLKCVMFLVNVIVFSVLCVFKIIFVLGVL